jgi:hypothetical protein
MTADVSLWKTVVIFSNIMYISNNKAREIADLMMQYIKFLNQILLSV